ncbi:polysaccharide deacetylase family protein [Kordiimonas aquimaris]|uniref:polysaccharide deacetylase family protein n=1 Tax=Kordiimonas aquimaris TaxID=707591 RepID=UPI0021CEBF11|nr:hypothetical protein [Kordiimonas aquimaris]
MSKIHITIDTEFSAGGCFHNHENTPITHDAVYCRINGVSHGLEFLLKTFKTYQIKATFFIEAAHTAMLGFDIMKPIIDDIKSNGHDIQLHIHPMWHEPARKALGDHIINDSMAALDLSTAKGVIELGMHAFDKWGLDQPVAFRAGNLQMNTEMPLDL